MDLERRRTWFRGIWEMLKEILLQKIKTYHLRSSPLIIPNHLHGMYVIVTGATSGIGLHTAKELAFAGAHVTMACRNLKRANEIYRQWREDSHNEKVLQVQVMELDLLSFSSVRKFASEWEKHQYPLHILINNAGVLLMGEPQKFSEDGIEQHVQVNHLAPALLSLLLIPYLLKPNSSRIVNVNSLAHLWGSVEFQSWNSRIEEHKFSSMEVYGSSKLANLMFLRALVNKLWDKNITSIQCIGVHPGIVSTNLVNGFRWNLIWYFDASEGARSVLFCSTNTEVSDHLEKGFAYYSSNCKPGKTSPLIHDKD